MQEEILRGFWRRLSLRIKTRVLKRRFFAYIPFFLVWNVIGQGYDAWSSSNLIVTMRMTKQKDGKCEFLVMLLSYCLSLGCYWYTISQPCYLSHLQLGNSPPATIRILTNTSLEWIKLAVLKNSRWMNGLKHTTN